MSTKLFIQEIRAGQQYLITQQFSEALQICEQVLMQQNDHFDALLIKAVALQHQQQLSAALSCVAQLKQQRPDFLPVLLIEIRIHKQLGNAELALKRVQSALNFAPTQAELWQELSFFLYQLGQHTAADEAYKKYLLFSAEHPLLSDSLRAFFAGQLAKSERSVRTFLQQHPNNVNGLRLLAEIALKLGILNDAQVLLEKALAIAPNYHLARLNYAHTLNKREKSQQALAQINLLEQAQPQHIPVLLVKAAILVKMNDFTAAQQLYQTILQKDPQQAAVWCSLGHVEKTIGNQQQSITCYSKAITIAPEQAEPYWSLANLKTYRFDSNMIENMLAVYQQIYAKQDEQAAYICFALGRAFEQQHAYEQSFTYYEQGNQIKRKIEPYDAKSITDLVQRNIAYFSQPVPHSEVNAEPTPIFIVGLPRSGSTLLEQILASHSMVDGTRELPDIMAIARQLGNKQLKHQQDMYPQSLAQLSGAQLAELGEKYLAGTAHHRAKAPFFIDKMPNNFLHIGLIKSILPNAKIIDARRHPKATCLSCFKQLFAVGQTFTNNLADLADYYTQYLEIMDFWQTRYPADILTVQYEDVVSNVAQQVEQILSFIGLPFETACINFHHNKRAVATASSEQVRQPINTNGINAWLPYQQYLTALDPLLER